MNYKKCTVCNNWFPATNEYFYKNKIKSGYSLHPYCKKCEIKKNDNWQKENPEKKKKYQDSFNRKRTQIIKENAKRQRLNGYFKEYQQKNKDKIKEYNEIRQHKNHDLTKKEWEECKRYFDYKCAYCGLPLDQHYGKYAGVIKLRDFHKEHVDDNGANNLSNCIPSCKKCNSLKWKYKFKEWYPNQFFYTEVRMNKIIKWLEEDYKKYIKIKNNTQ